MVVVLHTEFQNFTNSLTQMSMYLNMEDSFGHVAMLYLLGDKQSYSVGRMAEDRQVGLTC